jgi:hypothetical protein
MDGKTNCTTPAIAATISNDDKTDQQQWQWQWQQ